MASLKLFLLSSQASEVSYTYHTMFTTLKQIQTQANGKRETLEMIFTV